jgi:predicted amidohydrolase YtcJ
VLAEVERLAGTFGDNRKVRYLEGQVKMLADGAIISQLMQMKDGYIHGHHGEWIQPPEELDRITDIFWQAGYQLHIHVNGNLGLQSVVEILQNAWLHRLGGLLLVRRTDQCERPWELAPRQGFEQAPEAFAELCGE